MRFVACHLQQAQTRRSPRQSQGLAAAREKHFFLLLRQTGQRKCPKSYRSQRVLCSVQLTLATIDHTQIRQRLRFIHAPRKVSRHHFIHRRKVIVSPFTFDLELAVLGTLRTTILEPHHAGNRVLALRMRNIEAHKTAWHDCQAEFALQIVHRIGGAFIALVARELHLLEQVTRILHREVHQLPLGTALRYEQP